jgi:hypothetical protein
MTLPRTRRVARDPTEGCRASFANQARYLALALISSPHLTRAEPPAQRIRPAQPSRAIRCQASRDPSAAAGRPGRGPRAGTHGRDACRWTAHVIATGFLADRGGDRPARRSRQETARFPRASPANRADPRLLPSHTFCVGMLDLASVSTSVRSISNSVRRTPPPVSANLRRKPPLIARRAGHHCAPLQLSALWPSSNRL